MAVSKVVLTDGRTLIDLTQDTLEAEVLLAGYTAHGADGEPVTGTCAYDVDSSDATANVAEVLSGKTFAKGGAMHTGTMPNNGAVAGTISTKAGAYTVPKGYHDGSGKVQIDSTEQSKLVAANIRQGVTVLGVVGSMSGSEDVKAQTKSIEPSWTAQSVTPDTGYNYLTEVTVAAIGYAESSNSAGGITVTIG